MENYFETGINYKNVIRFVWPSIVMMLIMAVYYNIDSVLVANFLGEQELAAFSIAYPIQGIMWGLIVMLAAGSSAVVAIHLGEGKIEQANGEFTLVCVVSLVMGVAYTALTLIFLQPIIGFMGATEGTWQACEDFLKWFMLSAPAAFVGTLSEYYIRIDGKPVFTVFLYVANAVVHIVAALILMGPMQLGMAGCGMANLAGSLTMAIVGVGYFLVKERNIKFTKLQFSGSFVGKCLVNGSSEMVVEASGGIITFFVNMVCLQLAARSALSGETAIASMTIVANLNYMMLMFSMGFMLGVAPLISYYYGAQKFTIVNKIIRYTLVSILTVSVICFLITFFGAKPLVMIYERPGSELFEMSVTGVRLTAFAILICGFNVFGSAFFTAYGNGLISALISFSRTIAGQIGGLFLLAPLLGMTGVYSTYIFAEALTLILSFAMFRKYRDVYHYRITLRK